MAQKHFTRSVLFIKVELLIEFNVQQLYNNYNCILFSFVVTESDRLPLAPAFFCKKCFRAFHYDDDQRVGHFKAYHYLDHAGTE